MFRIMLFKKTSAAQHALSSSQKYTGKVETSPVVISGDFTKSRAQGNVVDQVRHPHVDDMTVLLRLELYINMKS